MQDGRLGRGLRFMPSITNADDLVSLSAVTANSTTGCLLSEGVTSPRSRKKRWREDGEVSLVLAISRQRNAFLFNTEWTIKALESAGNAACSGSWSLASWWITNSRHGMLFTTHKAPSLSEGGPRRAREQTQLPVPKICITIIQRYMEMPKLHMQMRSLGAGLGSRGSRTEQPPSPPHCLLHGRPCLVNFKASAAFREGDVRGLFFPIFICFLVSLEGTEKGLPWYSLSRSSQRISPMARPSVWGDFAYLPVSTMQGTSLVAGPKSRIRSPVFSCVAVRKKMVGKIPLFAEASGDREDAFQPGNYWLKFCYHGVKIIIKMVHSVLKHNTQDPLLVDIRGLRSCNSLCARLLRSFIIRFSLCGFASILQLRLKWSLCPFSFRSPKGLYLPQSGQMSLEIVVSLLTDLT